MFFINRHVLCRTVHFRSGGHQEPFGPQLPRCLQHVQGSFDIGVHIEVRRLIREGNTDESGEVKHHLATAHSRLDTIGVADVTGDNFDLAQ